MYSYVFFYADADSGLQINPKPAQNPILTICLTGIPCQLSLLCNQFGNFDRPTICKFHIFQNRYELLEPMLTLTRTHKYDLDEMRKF